MSSLFQNILKFAGILFAVLGFTGFQTWSLMYEVSGNAYIATLGLVLFEGGMLYWWMYFQQSAEGLLQMALSLMAAVFGLLLVGTATALHLGAVDAAQFGENTPAKLITVAAIINLVVKFLMPLLHPDVLKTTYERTTEGKILKQAYDRFQAKADDIAEELANQMAEDWIVGMRVKLANRHQSRLLPTGITALPNGKNDPVVLVIDEDDDDEETAVSNGHFNGNWHGKTNLTDEEVEQAIRRAEAEKAGVETAVSAPTQSADFLAKNGSQGG